MVDSRAHSFVHVLPGESRRYAGEVLGDVHQQRKRVGGLYVCVQRGMYGSKAMAGEGGQALAGRFRQTSTSSVNGSEACGCAC